MRIGTVKISPVFQLRNLWVGVYIKRRFVARTPTIYIQPFPCVGLEIVWLR